MHMNVFNHNAFSTVTMTEAMEDYDFKPDLIGSLGLFEDVPISTTHISVERRGNELRIIKTSPRGAPLEEAGRDQRNIRLFETSRIAKGDTISASEIQNMRHLVKRASCRQRLSLFRASRTDWLVMLS